MTAQFSAETRAGQFVRGLLGLDKVIFLGTVDPVLVDIAYHRPGAPDLYPARLRPELDKALTRRFYEQVLNGRQVHGIEEIAAAGYDEHDPLPGQGDGREGLRNRSTCSPRGWRPPSPSRTSSPMATGWSSAGPTAAGTSVSSSAYHQPAARTPSPASTSTASRTTGLPSTGT